MNKKAQIFEQGLVIVVFSICVIALISFLAYNQKIKLSLSEVYPAASIYQEQEEISFYANDAANIAIQKAFYETLKEAGKECPRSSENVNYVIWTKDCLMKNDRFRERFVYHAENAMSELDAKTKSITIDKDAIFFNFDMLQLNSSLKKSADIKISYNSDISFNNSLSSSNINLDFENLSSSVLDGWEKCKKESDLIKIKACMNNLKIKGWKLTIRNDDFFCDLTSEESYYTGKFEPLTLKLILEK